VPDAAPLVSMRGISKKFGGVTALDAVDLDVHAGEVLAIVGDNGAGKSTLIKILTGVYQPTSGGIEMDGQTRPPDRLSVATSMLFSRTPSRSIRTRSASG